MGQIFNSGALAGSEDPSRRWVVAVVIAIVMALALDATSGPAHAAQTSQPLAGGSTFQGADGNQDIEGSFTDWQTYADTPPGTNTAVTKLDSPVGTGNPAGPDYFYAGKEDTPDGWTLESDSGGIEPGKSNALAASSVRDPLQSKSFFYFSFVRELDSNSDTFYGVELNKVTTTWTNSKGTTIPCRTTGDLMISYHVNANAKNAVVSAHRWQGNDQSATHPECPTGGSGTFALVTLGINSQGHMNFETDIANYIRRDVLGTTLSAGRFGEGAINLSDTIGVGSNPCFSFGQVQLHSRSSGAFDSALQDTVDPAPLAVRNCSLMGTKFRDDNGDGIRQASETGLPGWTFWVDYDDDGTIDANEPSGVSDATGAYTITNINPAGQGQAVNGPFRIHEQAPAGVTGYSCTFPNTGTTGGGVDAHGCYWEATFSSTGNQSGFHFGNKPPGNIVVKKVNAGGTQSDAFGFSTTGLGADFTLAASTSAGQVFDGVADGTYTVTEKSTGQPAGYRLTDIDCDDTDSTQALNADRRATIVVAPGETVTCTFTNTKNASLRVVKSVVNNDGGTAGASAFSLHVKQGGTDVTGSPAAGSAAGTVYSLVPGSYAVSEAAPPSGYSQSGGVTGDCAANGDITLAAGETKTCTITNDDVAPRLTVIKAVTNDHGGTKSAGDFTMNVTGTDVSDASFAGVAGPAGKTVTLDAGSYSVDEGAHDGYAKSLSADCNGSIAIGETKTCTVTNDDVAPRLTVIKRVTNDHGGTKSAGDFTMNVTGTEVSDPSFAGVAGPGGKTVTLDAGSYSVDEIEDPAYAKTPSADCSGSIAIGESKTCTVTNNDVAPQLKVIKAVTNDHGGTKSAGDFTMNVTGTDVSDASFAGVAGPGGKTVTLDAGSYGVDEGAHDGYTKGLSTDCSGTIAIGETKTCTVTNNDIAPQLKVVKTVTNDHGGTKSAGDFTMNVTGTDVSDPSFAGVAGPGGKTVTLDAGSYGVDEGAHDGYTKGLSADCSGTIAIGESKTCTITNDDIAPQLKVVKAVTNDHGGTKSAGDFTMNVTGTDVSDASFAGVAGPTGKTVTLDAGSYSVDEGAHDGYAKSLSADCSGTIAIGESKTCTITNNDVAPRLTVIKTVVNNNGGTKSAGDFTMNVTGTEVSDASFLGIADPGKTVTLDAGTYSVDEGAHDGYAKSLSADCSGTIAIGESKTCTITNNDVAARLTVIKTVVNDHGGTKTAGDFTVNVTGTGVSDASFPGVADPGKTVTLDAGSYGVDEGAHDGYAKSLSADCAGTIAIGESKTCTVTNNDVAPQLKVIKTVTNGHGGTKSAGDFTMNVTGTDVSDPSFAGVAGPGGKTVTLDAGSYGVDEGAHDGYAKSLSADCSGTIAIGETKTCTITNNDIAPQLKVIKTVTNDHGGTKSAGDFTMSVTGTDVSDASFAGVAGPGGKTVTLDAGSYGVDEGAHDGYVKSRSADCSGTIAIGETKTCTITNNDIAPQLTVIKTVVNDGGGTRSAGDFTMNVTGTDVSDPSFAGVAGPAGKTVTLDASSYGVDEVEDPDYAKSLSADCSGTIAIDETKTCTITNTRRTGTLEVVKDLRPAGDTGRFDLRIDGVTESGPAGVGDNGTTGAKKVATGTHTVGELGHTGTDLANYESSTSCVDAQGAPVTVGVDGAVAVNERDAIVCTITNTRKTNPAIAVDKKERRGSTGAFEDGPINVHVGDTIEYEIDITNPGDTPLTVSLADPKCDPGTLTGPTGDTNSNDLLDPGETFTWRCSQVVEAADGEHVDNVAKATGVDPLDKVVTGEDRVVADVLDPSVVVVKAGDEVAYHGDKVTYEFTVSNTGNTPLHDVHVTDDRCAEVSSAPVSKVNDDGDELLERIGADGVNPEQWVFSCSRAIGDHAGGEENPIVNTATATAADSLGRTVTSTDRHTTRIVDPAVSVDKTGPETAQAGDLVAYSIAVGNTGDVAFPDPLVVVGDALCQAPPQLATRNGDASPATLDPGETWTYTCSVQTEVGQTRVDNVATVGTTDVNGRRVTGSDGAVTTLSQPKVTVLPVQVRPTPAPPVIQPAKVLPGRAKLRGPTGCPSSRKAAKAVVTGRQIRSVVFYVDGRRVRKVRHSQTRGRWTITLRPGRMAFGTHRVRARVVFKTASGTKPRTLTLVFNRCRPRVVPKFAG